MSGSRSSSRAAPTSKHKTSKNAPEAREDVAREHGIAVDSNPRIIKCKYYEKVMSGGVYRLQHHLAGTNKDVGVCRAVPDDVKSKIMEVAYTLQERSIKKSKLSSVDDGQASTEQQLDYSSQSGEDIFKRSVSSHQIINTIFKKELR
ncbi:hypothetical protein MLD38_010692 [Melastoma candidum]|uniref:Uncharacterized protein n=1 Tax=Melastoma candidum TaxID=119954 RepID=A0ACB9R0P1_9MYRT|nr:hypothetical protein MLD38_010692 [Melastoma candidum]